MDNRKTMKVSEETQSMLFAAWMATGQLTGKRPTYDKVIQEALFSLAQQPEYKKVFLDKTLEKYKKE